MPETAVKDGQGAVEPGPATSENLQALQCPITREFIADPVLAGDGYTYERESIQQHWANQLEGRLSGDDEADCGGCGRTEVRGVRTSPITGEELDGTLHVNRLVLDLIRSAIQEGRLPTEAREDWERRRQEVELSQRREDRAERCDGAEQVPAAQVAQLSIAVASAPPYERSAEHVRVVGHADAPRWGLAAKLRLAKTALACDFVEADAWAPDFMFQHCMVPACHVAFAVSKRRHHCRRCGRLVCSSCAPHSAVDFERLGDAENTEQDPGRRICGECLEDLLDRLERRALNATELQQVMVLDARLEQWTMMQCERHRLAVRTQLTERFSQQLAQQQLLQLREEEAQRRSAAQLQRAKELNDEIARLNRIDTTVMDDATVLRHVQNLSKAEAELKDLRRDDVSQAVSEASTAESAGVAAATQDSLDPALLALRQQWEQLLRQEVQHLSNEEALRHFEQISQLQEQIESAETRAALAFSSAAAQPGRHGGVFDEGNVAAEDFQRSRWPLPMALELPTAWPTPRMLRRQEQVLRAKRREALQVRQHFEVKMADLAQARQLEMQRRRELEMLREQEEQQRQHAERVAEERRQRAQELDDLARRAVAQMVGPERRARMCGRCRAGPIMNDACSNLATHNSDSSRRRANHCPRCNWFDRNWNNWPEWDGVYGPH
eukprot:s3590_g9.t1